MANTLCPVVVANSLILLLGLLAIGARAQKVTGQPGFESAAVLKERGYQVEEKYMTTTDGYVLQLVHAKNPLISDEVSKKRDPILFVHGILAQSTLFVVNSDNVQPKDFSSFNLLERNPILESQLLNDPSSRSLVTLALNFGHECWLMNRRGAPGSRQKVGPQNDGGSGVVPDQLLNPGSVVSNLGDVVDEVSNSFNSNFWNYSFDAQSEFDLPEVIDYVLDESGRQKLTLVCHSAGGQIGLMALSGQPELANKITSAILWSPSFTVGFNDVQALLQPLEPVLQNYVGSLPPAFSSPIIQSLLNEICFTKVAQETLCNLAADSFFGASGGYEPFKPKFINTFFYPSSSLELAQIFQTVRFGGVTHKYDYGSKQKNIAAYGQPEPPAYDLSKVTLKNIVFYVGTTDIQTSPKDVRFQADLLKVPHEFHLIDTTFNHQGYFYHDFNSILAIIPTLRDIHRFSSQAET